ncbi:prephenate dehydrogenase/arogenate dehydrogenase family protein [Kaarinaea lacus]
MIKQLTVIGVGLIGGSLARALQEAGIVDEIVGCGLDKDHLQQAIDLGVISKYETDVAKAVKGSDVVVVAVPVGAMETVFRKIKEAASEQTIITDVGSTKGSVISAVRAAYGEVPSNFVPGHPIAGTEKSGVGASFAGLFHQRRVVLTPMQNTDPSAVDRIRTMWEATGAIVSQMDVKHHDDVLAATSHLPHLLAFALVDTLAALDEKVEIFQYAAGGFRDFTRIASSDPQMWHDICVNNRDAILQILKRFQVDLEQLGSAIANDDSDYILDVFKRAKASRDQFSH